MKTLLLALFICLPLPCFGAGFIGPGSPQPVDSAQEALSAKDDAPCELTGRVIAKVRGRKDRYMFEDGTGQIIVKIKKKAFGKRTITPQNLVQIFGEVEENDKYANEIDVDSLTVIE